MDQVDKPYHEGVGEGVVDWLLAMTSSRTSLFDFMLGMSSMDAIFLYHVVEQRTTTRDLRAGFVD